MCNLYLYIFVACISIFNLNLLVQYKTKNFLDFINDDSVKDNNEKINIKNFNRIKEENEGYKNKINELEIIIKEKNNKINELEIFIKEKDNKINELELIIKEKDNKINELETIIKKLELIIKEKDNKINKLGNKIKEFENILNNSNYRIKELEKEIEKFKAYCLLPGEKLINIKFISIDQAIDFNIVAKNTVNFSKLENSLYDKYPKYRDTENYFLVNGKKLNKHRTLEENQIKDNDILTLGVIDE